VGQIKPYESNNSGAVGCPAGGAKTKVWVGVCVCVCVGPSVFEESTLDGVCLDVGESVDIL
jgi:hypothetical protein